MQVFSLVTCLWPGLPRLWWRGDWRALAMAMGFAVALNLALVSSLLWPETLPRALLATGWLGILAFWVICAWHGCRCLGGPFGRGEVDDLFLRAQREYLKGHWYEAERLLGEIVERQSGDVDAQLMLAALYRRTGRGGRARRTLGVLECTDGAEKWALEIAREQQILNRLEAVGTTGEGEGDV